MKRLPARRTTLLFFALLVLGLFLRTANLLDLADSPFFTRPVIDGQVYDQWARQIVAGKALAEPFYQDPLYPYFLALIYTLFGHSFWAVYLVQLLLGLGLLLLLYDITRRLFDRRAALVAMFLAAVYQPFIFYESQIEKTVLAVFMVALFLWAYVRSLGARSWFWPLAAGVSLGLAALTRANLLVFALLLPIVLIVSNPERPRRHEIEKARNGRRSLPSCFRVFVATPNRRRLNLSPALVALAGVGLVIVPVAVRNTVLAREPLLTTTQGGQNLYIGNSPYNLTGQYVAPPYVRPHPDFEQVDFQDYARKASGRKLSRGGVSGFYTRAAFDFARTRTRHFLSLLGIKSLLYFNNYEVPDNQDVYFFARYSWVQRLPGFGFGILFAFGLAGMILLTRGLLRRWTFIVFFFGYALSVIVFFVFSRYRLPALPALIPFAAAMLVWLAEGFRRAKPDPKRPGARSRLTFNWRRLAGGLALSAAGFVLTAYPIHKPTTFEAAQCLTNLASSYYQEGDTANAVATYEEALKLRPGHAEALRNLGILRYNQNRFDLAFAALEQAAQSDPSNPVTHHFLGKVHEAGHRVSDACREYRRAVALAPGRVEYRFSLAPVLQKLDSHAAALAQYDTMIQLAPDNAAVRHNHAVALYTLGLHQQAWDELQTARRLGGQINLPFEQAVRAALNR